MLSLDAREVGILLGALYAFEAFGVMLDDAPTDALEREMLIGKLSEYVETDESQY